MSPIRVWLVIKRVGVPTGTAGIVIYLITVLGMTFVSRTPFITDLSVVVPTGSLPTVLGIFGASVQLLISAARMKMRSSIGTPEMTIEKIEIIPNKQ